MKEVAFIGDVHGCISELHEVVDSAICRTSQLVFLGDYVDRGYSSREVIDYLVRLQRDETLSTTFLMGHHDQALLNALTSDGLDSFLRMGGASTIRSYVERPHADVQTQLREAVPEAHLTFLRSLVSHYTSDDVLAAHDQMIEDGVIVQQGQKFGIYGHRPQIDLLPRLESNRAFIDTGCGTLPGGRLSCLFWPSLSWIQSNPWRPSGQN